MGQMSLAVVELFVQIGAHSDYSFIVVKLANNSLGVIFSTILDTTFNITIFPLY